MPTNQKVNIDDSNYLPWLIQGGMGVGVSDWLLAKTVSELGQLGVVSGTGLDTILVRRLQDGDPTGKMQHALSHFPDARIAQKVLDQYLVPGGKKPEEWYCSSPMFTQTPSHSLLELTVAANFVEIFLAKEGHNGKVGINYLEKVQMPNLPSIYGAMMAGVDFVLMGAGIPRDIPQVLDKLAKHEEVSLRLNVEGETGEDKSYITFNPAQIIPNPEDYLKRPKFIAIIASNVLAKAMMKTTGKVDGFVIEGPTAGGHNAPPRGELELSDNGEPVYGPRDEVNLEKIKKLGLPFWLAGSYASPHKIKEAIEAGATGVQIGTAFALCEESGLKKEIKKEILTQIRDGTINVFTDPLASPTGFPFKVVQLPHTLSERVEYLSRIPVCDLGYLRQLYKKEEGVGYRCPSEPVEVFVKKGGKREDTEGRKCLCNALMADIGHPQLRNDGSEEKPLVTAGGDILAVSQFLKEGHDTYSVQKVIEVLVQYQTEFKKDNSTTSSISNPETINLTTTYSNPLENIMRLSKVNQTPPQDDNNS